MKACPFCRGRATKLVSLSHGTITCQQCGHAYEAGATSFQQQAYNAVARPASSKQGLSIRVTKEKRPTGGSSSGTSSE
jgi:ribosomal protein L37AE/L43A